MMRAIHKLLDPIRRRLSNVVARAVVSLANDSLKLQGLQLKVLADEVLDNVERFQQYGFTSVPLAGAEAILLCLGGHRDHPVVVAVDDRRYRKKNLAPGESALYTDEGDYILLKRGRIIEVFAGAKMKVTAPEVEVIASTKVTITSPLTAISQNVTIGGTLNVAGMATVGGLAATGVAGVSTVVGNLNITGGNVTADGIGLKTHVHSDPQGGTTGAPQ